MVSARRCLCLPYRAFQGMIERVGLDSLEELPNREKLIARRSEPGDKTRQRIDGRPPPAMQKQYLGRRRESQHMRGNRLCADRAPVPRIVGPQHDIISAGLSDAYGRFVITSMRRTNHRPQSRIGNDRAQQLRRVIKLAPDRRSIDLIEVRMRERMIANLVPARRNTPNEFGILLAIAP